MPKRADKVIIAVHYSDSSNSNRVIKTLKVCDYDGDNHLGKENTLSRDKVITDIKNNGITYVTVYKSNGDYSWGKKVIVCRVGSEYYIKTEKNEKTEDNLGEIEEF